MNILMYVLEMCVQIWRSKVEIQELCSPSVAFRCFVGVAFLTLLLHYEIPRISAASEAKGLS